MPFAALVWFLAACADPSDTDSANPDANGLGDVPPYPAVNSATIRTGGADTTFECVSNPSGFRVVDDPADPDQQALSLYCGADDSDPSNLAVLRFTDVGQFDVGTYGGEEGDEKAGRTLQVTLVRDGVTTIANTSSFGHSLDIASLDVSGQGGAGTFQATWSEVQVDAEGDGSYETLEQPSALACEYEFAAD
jgi:hypothetical protein